MVAPEAAFVALRAAVADPDCPFRARFADLHGHAELRVAESERHFWSPTLGLEIRADDAGTTTVHGLFGPHPTVWTFFVFLHFAAATCATLGLVLAWSQWSLGESAWGLWSVPLAALLSGGAYAASHVGQRLAHDQMDAMLTFVDHELLERNQDRPPQLEEATP